MASNLPPDLPDFFGSEPVPVTRQAAQSRGAVADRLPQAVVDKLMSLAGVDGVWIERDASGQRVVVLHYTPKGVKAHLPEAVEGMPTRIVGGEPIRAQ